MNELIILTEIVLNSLLPCAYVYVCTPYFGVCAVVAMYAMYVDVILDRHIISYEYLPLIHLLLLLLYGSQQQR